MKITDVKVTLANRNYEHLLGFASVVFDDCFVVRDLKVIAGRGGPFVAMPSRRMTDKCHECGNKNHYQAWFCHWCGTRLDGRRAPVDDAGKHTLYQDVCHPITQDMRQYINEVVVEEYQRAIESGHEN